MQCPNCKAQLDEGALFCGNCGKQIASPYGRGNAATEISHSGGDSFWNAPQPPAGSYQGGPVSPMPGQPNPLSPFPPGNRQYQQAPPGAFTTPAQPSPRQFDATTAAPVPGQPVTPYPPSHPPMGPHTNRRRSRTFLSIIIVLCVIALSAGVIAFMQGGGFGGTKAQVSPTAVGTQQGTTPTATQGTTANAAQAVVLFTDDATKPGISNNIEVDTTNLPAPANGSHYVAWLISDDTTNEDIQQLGTLSASDRTDTPGKFVLKKTLANTNLLATGNRIAITLESGDTNQPSDGKTVLSGRFPPDAFVHVRHLLVGINITPNQIGLLVGLREQAKLLDEQGELIKNNRNDKNVVKCALRNMLFLIEGGKGDIPQVDNCQSVGDGFGLLGVEGDTSNYVTAAGKHAGLAKASDDATPTLRLHAGHVDIALANITKWLQSLDKDARSLLTKPNDAGKLNELIRLSAAVFHGQDLNDNGTVEPIVDEAGAETAYQHGQLMATLTLNAPTTTP